MFRTKLSDKGVHALWTVLSISPLQLMLGYLNILSTIMLCALTFYEVKRIEGMPSSRRKATKVQNLYEQVLENPIVIKYATMKNENTHLSAKYQKDFQVKTLEDFLAEQSCRNQIEEDTFEVSSKMEESMAYTSTDYPDETPLYPNDAELSLEQDLPGDEIKAGGPEKNPITFIKEYENGSFPESSEETEKTKRHNSINFAWALRNLFNNEASFKAEAIDTIAKSTPFRPIMNYYKDKRNGVDFKTLNVVQCNSLGDLEAKLLGIKNTSIKCNSNSGCVKRFEDGNTIKLPEVKLVSKKHQRNERSISNTQEVSDLSDTKKTDSIIIIGNIPFYLAPIESTNESIAIKTLSPLRHSYNNIKVSESETHGEIQKCLAISEKQQEHEEYDDRKEFNTESLKAPELGHVYGLVKDNSGKSPAFYILYQMTKKPNEKMNGKLSVVNRPSDSQGESIFLRTSSTDDIKLRSQHYSITTSQNELPSYNLFSTRNPNELLDPQNRFKNDKKNKRLRYNIFHAPKKLSCSGSNKLLHESSFGCYNIVKANNQYNLFQTTERLKNIFDKATLNSTNMWKRDFPAENTSIKAFLFNITDLGFRFDHEAEIIRTLKAKNKKGNSNLVYSEVERTERFKWPTTALYSIDANYNKILNESCIDDGMSHFQTSTNNPSTIPKRKAWKIIILQQEETNKPSFRATKENISRNIQADEIKATKGEQNSYPDNPFLNQTNHCQSSIPSPRLEGTEIKQVCHNRNPSSDAGIKYFEDSSSQPIGVEMRFFFNTDCPATTPIPLINPHYSPLRFEIKKNSLVDAIDQTESYYEYTSEKEENKFMPKLASSTYNKIKDNINNISTRKPIKYLIEELIDAIESAPEDYGDYSYYVPDDDGSTKMPQAQNTLYDLLQSNKNLTSQIYFNSSTNKKETSNGSAEEKCIISGRTTKKSMNKDNYEKSKSYFYNNLLEDININNAADIKKLKQLKKQLSQFKSLYSFENRSFPTPIPFGDLFSHRIQIAPFDLKLSNVNIKDSADDLNEFRPNNASNSEPNDSPEMFNEKNKSKEDLHYNTGFSRLNLTWEELFKPTSKLVRKSSNNSQTSLKNDSIYNNDTITNTKEQLVSKNLKGGISLFFGNLFHSKKMGNESIISFNNTVTQNRKENTRINNRNTTHKTPKEFCNKSDGLKSRNYNKLPKIYENFLQELWRKKRTLEKTKSDKHKNGPSCSALRKRVTKLLQPEEDVYKKFENLQKNLQDLQNSILIHSKRDLDKGEKNLALQLRVIVNIVNSTLSSQNRSTNELLNMNSKVTSEKIVNNRTMENLPIFFDHDTPLKENKETIGNADFLNASGTKNKGEYKKHSLSKISKDSFHQINENIIQNITTLIDLLIESFEKRKNNETQQNPNIRIKRHGFVKVFPYRENIRQINLLSPKFRRNGMVLEDLENCSKFYSDRSTDSQLKNIQDLLTFLRKRLEKNSSSKSSSCNVSDFIRGYRQVHQNKYLKKDTRMTKADTAAQAKEKYRSNSNELERWYGFNDQNTTKFNKYYNGYFGTKNRNSKIKNKLTDPLSRKVLKEIWLIENELQQLMIKKSRTQGYKPQQLLKGKYNGIINTEHSDKTLEGLAEINKYYTAHHYVPPKIRPHSIKAINAKENPSQSFKSSYNNGPGSLYEEILSKSIAEQKQTTPFYEAQPYLDYNESSKQISRDSLECRPKNKNIMDIMQNETTLKTIDSKIIIEDEGIDYNDLNFHDSTKSNYSIQNENIQAASDTIKLRQNAIVNKKTSADMSREECETITCEHIPNDSLVPTITLNVTRSPGKTTITPKSTGTGRGMKSFETTCNTKFTRTPTRTKSNETCTKGLSTTATKTKEATEETSGMPYELETRKTTIKHRGIQCHHNYKNHTNRKEHRMTTKPDQITETRNRLFWKIIS